MALFGKKKEEKEKTACACSCESSAVHEAESKTAECCGGAVKEISSIRVLGSGCKNCHMLLEETKKAVQSMGLSVEVEYITDLEQIMQYGVMSMPALAVNGQVVSAGKVRKAAEIEKLLRACMA